MTSNLAYNITNRLGALVLQVCTTTDHSESFYYIMTMIQDQRIDDLVRFIQDNHTLNDHNDVNQAIVDTITGA